MNIIDRIFSDKYVNHGAVVGNVLLLMMYRFAYPFAVLLNKLRLTPNQITSCSLLSSCCAFLALVFDRGWGVFAICWAGSVLLDFCDGTVARMTARVSRSAFRYDHMSDIFKISLVVMGVGIRNDDAIFWVLCYAFVFIYNYSEIVEHDLKTALARTANDNNSAREARVDKTQEVGQSRSGLAKLLKRNFPRGVKILSNLYATVIGFNGHTLLVFFALPLSGWITIVVLLYLIFISLISAVRGIKTLHHMRR